MTVSFQSKRSWKLDKIKLFMFGYVKKWQVDKKDQICYGYTLIANQSFVSICEQMANPTNIGYMFVLIYSEGRVLG